MTKRILLAGLYHETHTFVDEITPLADVRIRRGPEILARRGDASTIDAFFAVAEARKWRVVPTVDYNVTPSGTLDQAVFDQFWSELEAASREALRDGIDAVWLALHGAMVTTGMHDPEGVLLERLRALPELADVAIFGVFDLHATFTDAMARQADGLVAYRENPHTDAYEAAERSALLLARALDTGVRPRMVWRRLPIVWPPTGTGTADSPMRDLEAAARAIEAADAHVWAANIVAGFAFADTPETGVSVSLITDGTEADAHVHLQRLADIATAMREKGLPEEWPLEAAIDHALARGPLRGPVAFVEPADNIGGGAPGDCTSILRAFLARGLERAVAVINDPEAVAALAGVPLGARKTLPIGGKGSHLDPGPVVIEVELLSQSDGRFTLEDRNSHLASMIGLHADMGPCATVRAGGTMILLTSRKTPPFDLAQLRSQGIAPEQQAFIAVKAAVAHRRAYEPILAASYWVATPGSCASDLTRLPYRHISRPIFPLDS